MGTEDDAPTTSTGKLNEYDGTRTLPLLTRTHNIYSEGTIDPIYQAKAMILNDALQEIGMGRYQVWPRFSFRLHCLTAAVVSFFRGWVRVVFVSILLELFYFF